MFIQSAQNICVQANVGTALVGLSSPAPAYISAQFSLTESQARDFAAALVIVADQLAQQAVDNARLADIKDQRNEADERAAARVDRMDRSRTFHDVSVAGQIAGLRA